MQRTRPLSQVLNSCIQCLVCKDFPQLSAFFVQKLVHFHCDTQCIQIMPSLRLDHKKPLFYIVEWLDKRISRILSSKQTFSNLSCSKDLIYILFWRWRIIRKETEQINWAIDRLTAENWIHCYSFKSILIDRPYLGLVLPHWVSVIDLLADLDAVVLRSVYLYRMAQSALLMAVCLYVLCFVFEFACLVDKGCHSSLS